MSCSNKEIVSQVHRWILVEISRVLDDAAVILDSRYIQDRGGGWKRGRRTNQISESIIVHTSSNSNPYNRE